MKIDIYTLCKNEVKLAPFFIDYWNSLGDDINVYIYDGLSSDGCRELFAKYDNIHVIDFEPDALDDGAHTKLKNNCWKSSKADFVVVCDFDEAIAPLNPGTLHNELQYMKEHGYSILLPCSFSIISDKFPKYKKGKYLHELAKYGFNDCGWFAKAILFDPSKITEINYVDGGHCIRPTGDVKYWVSTNLFMIHAKYVGFDYYKERIDNRVIAEYGKKMGYLGETDLSYQQMLDKFNNYKAQRFKWTDIKEHFEEYYAVMLDWSRWGGKKIVYKSKESDKIDFNNDFMYVSYHDMHNVIKNNLWKISKDTLFVVGIPRGGMIAALMIAELLNIPCVDIDSFIKGEFKNKGGYRLSLANLKNKSSVLVVDDTVYSGRQLAANKKLLSKFDNQNLKINYACVYVESEKAKEMVDIYFSDITMNKKFIMHEWNVFHRGPDKTPNVIYDLDGVLCKNPPDDNNIEAYEAYLKDAIPMIVPTTTIGAICTYRIDKYRQVTEEWLNKMEIKTNRLIMYPAQTLEERNKVPPYVYKAEYYKRCDWAYIFIESNPFEAQQIAALSHKPVLCFENGILYKSS